MDLEALCAELRHRPLHQSLFIVRRQTGASQRLLAERAGLKQSVISRLERGGDAMMSTWLKAFSALGCELLVRCTDDEALFDLSRDQVWRENERQKGLAPNWERGRRR